MPDPQENKKPLPLQPIGLSKAKVTRFQTNDVVRFLLESVESGRKLNLNDLWTMQPSMFSMEDMAQFYQMIGYSICGYAEIFGDRLPDHVDFVNSMQSRLGLSTNSEEQLRWEIDHLRDKLKRLRRMFKEGCSELYNIHPEDLMEDEDEEDEEDEAESDG